MREIKFRAWAKAGKNTAPVMFQDRDMSLVFKLNNKGGFEKYHAEEYTLMQYTGLKDKNGTEIYEGDIVKDYRVENSEAVIEYCQPIAAFVARPIVKAPHDVYQLNQGNTVGELQLTHTEVIGNIYENPELLEAK